MMVTMLPKVVVFLACLCVVKAGVLTVNAYEDQYDDITNVNDDAETLDRSVQNCDNSQCNSLCRALGLTQGVCISPTVCRCSGRSADISNAEATHDDIYQEIANVNDGADTLDRSVEICVNLLCNNLCRALGFEQGVCISPIVCRCS